MPFEVDFLPVGDSYGDAIVIRYETAAGSMLHIVDGGRTDTADTIIQHLGQYYPGYFINHMVLSHADNDHACGLVGVLRHFRVDHLWMNRPWLYAAEVLHHFHGNYSREGLVAEMRARHPYLVELEQIANAKGTLIHDVFQGAVIGAFTVLAPSRQRYVHLIPDFEKTPTSFAAKISQPRGLFDAVLQTARNWFEETWDVETLSQYPQPPTSASNESCVVQYGILEPGKEVLLTADVGPEGLTEAADYGSLLHYDRPHFVQMPHHGSRHNVTPQILDRWLGQRVAPGTRIGTAFCSIGSNKPDYPRGQVTNAFKRRGFEVFANRTRCITHYSGQGHTSMVPITPEPFATEVEAP